MVIISASISQRDKDFLDSLVKTGKYSSRSGAITTAIELLRKKETYPSPYENNHYPRNTHKPPTSLSGGAHSYKISAQDHTNLMNELKKKQMERGLRDPPQIEKIDAGFDILEFDPTKCKEALMEEGCVVQCPNYRLDGEDYCHEHIKKKKWLIA